jgi:hypothetical protein
MNFTDIMDNVVIKDITDKIRHQKHHVYQFYIT